MTRCRLATEELSGVAIDSRISRQQKNLRSGSCRNESREMISVVNRLNQRALELLEDFIDFKENILEGVSKGKLFNANYPLLIQHILREAKLYKTTIKQLQGNERLSYKDLAETEEFWNRIMMEHALFVRGLLDPTEVKLIGTADSFAMEYQELLKRARQQDDKAMSLADHVLREANHYIRLLESR